MIEIEGIEKDILVCNQLMVSLCYMLFAHELFAKVHVHLQQLHLFTVVFNQT